MLMFSCMQPNHTYPNATCALSILFFNYRIVVSREILNGQNNKTRSVGLHKFGRFCQDKMTKLQLIGLQPSSSYFFLVFFLSLVVLCTFFTQFVVCVPIDWDWTFFNKCLLLCYCAFIHLSIRRNRMPAPPSMS